MKFQGAVLSIGELLARSGDAPTGLSGIEESITQAALLYTAADNARRCIELLDAGEPLDTAWRFGILQTLDDYRSAVARGGITLAAGVFEVEPQPTGAVELDAAFAALAAYLAERDGWLAPQWAASDKRIAAAWYPAVPEIFREEAEAFSPRAFRSRGIYITERSLARA